MRRTLLAPLLLVGLLACGSDENPDVKLGGPVDADGDGYPEEHDCDDNDAAINAGADELCDGVDNDCDDEVDERAIDQATFYADADGDGFGDPDATTLACSVPSGHVDNADDCDDSDAEISPAAAEVCNEEDDDCDGLVDAEDDSIDTAELYTVWPDLDGDNKGDSNAASLLSCTTRNGVSLEQADCDDGDPSTYVGAANLESQTDCMQDLDNDGYGSASPLSDAATPGTDCDDGNSLVSPNEDETCGNGIDDDCDGDIDEGCE